MTSVRFKSSKDSLNRITFGLFLSVLAILVMGFGKPKYSSIQVKDDNSKQQMIFQVVPTENMAINADAPWKLEITEAKGVDLPTRKFGKEQLNEDIPGYAVKLNKAKEKSGSIAYKFIAFICTKDKTQCYREVHNLKHTW